MFWFGDYLFSILLFKIKSFLKSYKKSVIFAGFTIPNFIVLFFLLLLHDIGSNVVVCDVPKKCDPTSA